MAEANLSRNVTTPSQVLHRARLRPFIPYDAPFGPREPRSAKDAKQNYNLVLSHDQVETVRKLAYNIRPLDMIKQALIEEKKGLHLRSQESVNKWENTIMGQRKKRLAAQAERLRLSEEERQRVDAEWAKVKASEREAAVERARHMQYVQQPAVRRLHAELLTSQVLLERERQLDYKQKKKEHDDKILFAAEEKRRIMEELALDREWDEAQEQRTVMLERVRLDGEERERKAAEHAALQKRLGKFVVPKDAKEEEDNHWFYVAVHKREREEIEAEKQKQLQKRAAYTRDVHESLQVNREERKIIQQQKDSFDYVLDVDSKNFQNVKNASNNKRHQRGVETIRQRQDVTQQVFAVQDVEYAKRDTKRDQFLKALEMAYRGQPERVHAEKRRQKQLQLDADEKWRQSKLAEQGAARLREKQSDYEERLRIRTAYEEFTEAQDTEKKKRITKAIELREHHKAAMAKRKTEQQTKKAENLAQEVAILKQLDDENDAFVNYAQTLANEVEESGKDVRPILRVMRAQRKTVPPKPVNSGYANARPGNECIQREETGEPVSLQMASTWERLGFCSG
ncbi:hypothetical protein BJ742DRAFT_23495 [Cladochytrium replicatum]|nr:hypothetical protein BJ742DRAFT_23495 [Cladochytrium replicatum]